jgi:hypothetical protein
VFPLLGLVAWFQQLRSPGRGGGYPNYYRSARFSNKQPTKASAVAWRGLHVCQIAETPGKPKGRDEVRAAFYFRK